MADNAGISWSWLPGSAILALLVAIWPLPDWASWLRPELAACIVIYWVVCAPFRIGMFHAWVLGLLLDVLEGAVFGQNALALTVVAYLAFLLNHRLAMFSLLEQALAVFVLIGIHQLIGYWVHGLTGSTYYSMAFLVPALTSAILWPVLKISLDRFRLAY